MAPTTTRTGSRSSTRSTRASSRNGSRSNGQRRQDAIALLKADHREVEGLFKRFEKAGDGAHREKQSLVREMITELSHHTAAEEQVLYPWAREYIEDEDDLVLESVEEHRLAKWVLAELSTMDAEDERFDARVTVMMELVRHHVKEEEHELFPDLRDVATRAELLDLGERLEAAKRSAPPVPDVGAGLFTAAVEHARDVGKDVVGRIGALAGSE
jgi:hemerythrin superfamily protein